MMVTIKTLKDRMRQTYPHLSDEEIENTKILIDDRCLSHYIENERIKEPQRTCFDEYRICIDIQGLAIDPRLL